jgi:hypothetical protein
MKLKLKNENETENENENRLCGVPRRIFILVTYGEKTMDHGGLCMS